MNTLEIENTTFDVSFTSIPVSVLRENKSKLVVVERYTWLLAIDYGCPVCMQEMEAKGVNVYSHVEVADYFKDLTGWCPVEQKIEYASDERIVLAPRELIAEHTTDFTFEDRAADAGYGDYV